MSNNFLRNCSSPVHISDKLLTHIPLLQKTGSNHSRFHQWCLYPFGYLFIGSLWWWKIIDIIVCSSSETYPGHKMEDQHEGDFLTKVGHIWMTVWADRSIMLLTAAMIRHLHFGPYPLPTHQFTDLYCSSVPFHKRSGFSNKHLIHLYSLEWYCGLESPKITKSRKRFFNNFHSKL